MSQPQSRIPVGSVVRVVELPPFLKSADPMPMLRSPQWIQINETGTIVDQRPGGYYGVRFANGVFLVDHRYLAEVVEENSMDVPSSEAAGT